MTTKPVYQEEVENIKELGSQKQLTWNGKRKVLTEKYGWTIPNQRLITELVSQSRESLLYEIGAGNGYLSYEIHKNGGITYPIDISVNHDETWVDVHEMCFTELDKTDVNSIILPWPPANSSMGFDCVTYLKPDVVYFIGKPNSTITGNNKLFEYLTENYENEMSFALPSWTKNNSVCIKYVKKNINNYK